MLLEFRFGGLTSCSRCDLDAIACLTFSNLRYCRLYPCALLVKSKIKSDILPHAPLSGPLADLRRLCLDLRQPTKFPGWHLIRMVVVFLREFPGIVAIRERFAEREN